MATPSGYECVTSPPSSPDGVPTGWMRRRVVDCAWLPACRPTGASKRRAEAKPSGSRCGATRSEHLRSGTPISTWTPCSAPSARAPRRSAPPGFGHDGMSVTSPLIEVHLLALPVRLAARSQQHFEELMREFILIAAGQHEGHS